MAIILEEEKKKINWFAIGVILVIFAVSAAAVYYLFIVNPASVEVIVPVGLKNLKETVQIKFDPQEIFENPVVKNLKSSESSITPEPTFNPNPFR